jgi:hypothetical protein
MKTTPGQLEDSRAEVSEKEKEKENGEKEKGKAPAEEDFSDHVKEKAAEERVMRLKSSMTNPTREPPSKVKAKEKEAKVKARKVKANPKEREMARQMPPPRPHHNHLKIVLTMRSGMMTTMTGPGILKMLIGRPKTGLKINGRSLTREIPSLSSPCAPVTKPIASNRASQ